MGRDREEEERTKEEETKIKKGEREFNLNSITNPTSLSAASLSHSICSLPAVRSHAESFSLVFSFFFLFYFEENKLPVFLAFFYTQNLWLDSVRSRFLLLRRRD